MIQNSGKIVVDASKHVDASNRPVTSASLLAAAILTALDGGENVTVDFSGMRRISSSYFNVIVAEIVGRFGADSLDERVSFLFSSQAQQEIFNRSRAAVLANIST